MATDRFCAPAIWVLCEDGELFVTGRFKDLIIVRGRNHYPQDIETTVVGASPAIRPGTCAAFSVDSGTEEKVVVILEMPRPRPEHLDMLAGDIRQAVVGRPRTSGVRHRLGAAGRYSKDVERQSAAPRVQGPVCFRRAGDG